MSNIVELLTKSAEVEKQSYHAYIKDFASSGISSLVSGGVSFEKAAGMMKVACNQDKKISQMGLNIQTLEKVAEYITELEDKVGTLEKVAEQYQHEESVSGSEPLQKLSSLGFSTEELEYLSVLPENLLEKVASSNSAPWELGSGAGFAREKTDPLLEFLIG